MKNQRGFTLVEILVGLTLSLLLVVGVAQIFTGNRETYRLQSGMATLQENARFAMDALRRDLSMAGYPQDQAVSPFVTAQTTDGGGNLSDTVTVRYLTRTDCEGTPQPPTFINRTYTVVKTGTVSGLYCNSTLVVDGVENMQLQYGVDLDWKDDEHTAHTYLTASEVPNWSQVVAVRFALLISTNEPVSREKDSGSYILLDAPAITPAADELRRKIYSGTVQLRNAVKIPF